MDLNSFEKIVTIFKYMISSFMNIEILLIILLFFGLIFLNVKRNNLYFKIGAIVSLIIFFITIFIYYSSYVGECVTKFIKLLLNLFYFPPTGVYFVYMIFVFIVLIINLFYKKIDIIFRRINIVYSGVLFLFYSDAIAFILTNKNNVFDKASVYGDNILLSIIQISNLLLVIWIAFMIGYILYMVFKKEDNT